MKPFYFLVFFCSIALGSTSFARTFEVDAFQSSAEFKLFYTFGTHTAKSIDVNGELKIEKDHFLEAVRVTIPIEGFKTGKPTLDCHIKESLGLNYSQSDFPKEHVCKNDQLDSKGKNSIAYPTLEFNSKQSIDLDVSVQQKITGTFSVHGVNRDLPVEITIVKQQDRILVKGHSEMKLSDFGIVAKKFLFISVKDVIRAEWSIAFKAEDQK